MDGENNDRNCKETDRDSNECAGKEEPKKFKVRNCRKDKAVAVSFADDCIDCVLDDQAADPDINVYAV